MAEAEDVVDVSAVNVIVRRAVEGINISQQRQTLEIQDAVQQPLPLTNHDMQYFVNLLQSHPLAVDTLSIIQCGLSQEALEILRAYFISRAMSLNHIYLNKMNLGNANGRRLLSGLRFNTSVTWLDLFSVGLEGAGGGTVISELLQNNPHLTTLHCDSLRLGPPGVLALQASLRTNQTLQACGLTHCDLGDEGISLIVDTLQENTTMIYLDFSGNGITSSNGLPHVTRLLESEALSLRAFAAGSTPGLFDNQHNFGLFLIALQNSQVTTVSMNFCQLSGHVMVSLFQALSFKTTPTFLSVYDTVQLQGADLERLLEIIPYMRNLYILHINLDWMDESVLSSFHRNTSIRHLYTHQGTSFWQEVTSGPIFEIVKRNRWLPYANRLLNCEPLRTIPLEGLWSNAVERLGRDNIGATALYIIMREKLVWWATDQAAASPAGSTTNAPAVVASTSAVDAPLISSMTGRRSRAQDDNDADSTTDWTKNNTETSSSSTTTSTTLEPPSPAQKRARH